MRNFERVPHALSYDTNLSLGARAAYPLLRDMAWRAGRRENGDAVELPTIEEIARVLGCASSTVKTYLAELRASGWLSTTRAARNRPTLYTIWDAPVSRNSAVPRADIRPTGAAASISPSTDNPYRQLLAGETKPEKAEDAAGPKLVLVEGHNPALDALIDVCGISQRSPRIGEAVAALNGHGAGQPGIRRQRWQELRDLYPDRALDAAEHTGEVYETALANAIRKRAEMYHQKMPGATLTPGALAKWWTDLPRLANPRRGGAPSPEELMERAQRLQEQGR